MANTTSITGGFVDLATYDELEKYMYGGSEATAYFVCNHKTATWFTIIPTQLNTNMGQSNSFNSEWSASISRAGDYMKSAWLRAVVSQVKFNQSTQQLLGRWTHNLGHNLIKECSITFNDLVAARFDSYFLDFWAAFTVPASKQVGYNNMIGNVPELTHGAQNLPSYTLNVPLPFFFTRDTGVGLPTAALPYNEMRINFQVRDWTELLVVYPNATSPGRPATAADVLTAPTLSSTYVWAEYAIVSNDERKRMGCAPRDILVEQVQTAPRTTFILGDQQASSTDIRFSHAVKALFFAVRNTSVASEYSNYTIGNIGTGGQPLKNVDPLSNATLLYENTQRLAGLPADYYSLVEPWFKAPTIPSATGYHMYSYSLNVYDINPLGSTNFGKLTNVTLDLASQGKTLPADSGKVTADGRTIKYTYQTIICAMNHNVIRISGGALGFPVL